MPYRLGTYNQRYSQITFPGDRVVEPVAMSSHSSNEHRLRRAIRRLFDALDRVLDATREANAARDALCSAASKPDLRVVLRNLESEDRSTPQQTGGATAGGGVE
jgi:hypothetical protein